MKTIILAFIAAVTLTSCADNGKKVKIEGSKGEVYYKGDGVTEDDAKKTGQYLLKENYFNNAKGATVQVTKEGEAYHVRFVYDKAVFDSVKGIEGAFKLLGVSMSKEVFADKQVNISLADPKMKDFKTINWDEAYVKSLEAPAPPPAENTNPQ